MLKRILILQQTDSRFALPGKELCGMVKLVCTSHTDATVFVTNAQTQVYGEWWVLLSFGGEQFCHRLATLNNDVFSLPFCDLSSVSCLLVKREDDCFEAAFAQHGPKNFCGNLRREMRNMCTVSASDFASQAAFSQARVLRQNPAKIPQNSRFSAFFDIADAAANCSPGATSACAPNTAPNAVEDFAQSAEQSTNQPGTNSPFWDDQATPDVQSLRQNADARYRSVQDYSAAYERFYASGGSNNYYQTVRREIGLVFTQFPPYYPLIRRLAGSFFVRIDFPLSDKFFLLGVIQQRQKVRYICYGLPATNGPVDDKDFVFVEASPVSFHMLFQDAQTGQIATPQGVEI